MIAEVEKGIAAAAPVAACTAVEDIDSSPTIAVVAETNWIVMGWKLVGGWMKAYCCGR